LRLKFLVSIFRLLVTLTNVLKSLPKPKPDSVMKIPSRDNGRFIKAHLYKPVAEGSRIGNPRPVLINFCGSGFAIPLHGMDDDFCRHIAKVAGYVVLDVEYRLGPEHPFPAAIHDVEDAVRYVLDHPGEYQTAHVSVSGFSSGGTLALVAPTLFPRGTFQSAIAFYPAMNLAVDPGLRKAPVPGVKPRSPFPTRIFREAYVRDMDPRDPRISPAYADTFNYPANILVVTGERDSSAPEAEEFAEKVRNTSQTGSRNVLLRRMKGCGHAFDKNRKDEVLVQARDEAYGLAVDLLKVASSSG
jgi:acetyl esterase/lipase